MRLSDDLRPLYDVKVLHALRRRLKDLFLEKGRLTDPYYDESLRVVTAADILKRTAYTDHVKLCHSVSLLKLSDRFLCDDLE